MFTFTDHIDYDDTPSHVDAAACVLAIHERLAFHGIEATLHLDGSTLRCQSGGQWFDGTRRPSPAASAAITRQQAINGLSWKGLTPEAIDNALPAQHERVNKALRRAIDAPDAGTLETRLKQAIDDGFDVFTFRYHETTKSAVAPLQREGFDQSADGPSRRDYIMPSGMFMKATQASLSLHPESVQVPFVQRSGRTLTVADRDVLKHALSAEPALRDRLVAIKQKDVRFDEQAGVVIDKLKSAPGDANIKAEFDALLAQWRHEISADSIEARQAITAHLRAQGYAYLNVESDQGSLGRHASSIISLNPAYDVRAADIDHIHKPTFPRISAASAPLPDGYTWSDHDPACPFSELPEALQAEVEALVEDEGLYVDSPETTRLVGCVMDNAGQPAGAVWARLEGETLVADLAARVQGEGIGGALMTHIVDLHQRLREQRPVTLSMMVVNPDIVSALHRRGLMITSNEAERPSEFCVYMSPCDPASVQLREHLQTAPDAFFDSAGATSGPLLMEAVDGVIRGEELSDAQQQALVEWLPQAPLPTFTKAFLADNLKLTDKAWPVTPDAPEEKPVTALSKNAPAPMVQTARLSR